MAVRVLVDDNTYFLNNPMEAESVNNFSLPVVLTPVSEGLNDLD